jgi:hypothetical protein
LYAEILAIVKVIFGRFFEAAPAGNETCRDTVDYDCFSTSAATAISDSAAPRDKVINSTDIEQSREFFVVWMQFHLCHTPSVV